MLTPRVIRSASYWCQVGQQTWTISLDPLLVHCWPSLTKLLGAKPVLSACSCTPLQSTQDLGVCANFSPRFPLVCLLFATTTIMTTSSRMTYAFARYVNCSTIRRGLASHTDPSCRDGGLPASRFFAKVHSKHEMPLNALILTTVLVVIFGCIFLGSSR